MKVSGAINGKGEYFGQDHSSKVKEPAIDL
jgi:hypothetical protein